MCVCVCVSDAPNIGTSEATAVTLSCCGRPGCDWCRRIHAVRDSMMSACTHTHTHTHTDTHIYARRHTLAHVETSSHTHTSTHIHTSRTLHTRRRRQADTPTPTHTHTHWRTLTHTHTHLDYLWSEWRVQRQQRDQGCCVSLCLHEPHGSVTACRRLVSRCKQRRHDWEHALM